MDIIIYFIDFFIHLDKYLPVIIKSFGEGLCMWGARGGTAWGTGEGRWRLWGRRVWCGEAAVQHGVV